MCISSAVPKSGMSSFIICMILYDQDLPFFRSKSRSICFLSLFVIKKWAVCPIWPEQPCSYRCSKLFYHLSLRCTKWPLMWINPGIVKHSSGAQWVEVRSRNDDVYHWSGGSMEMALIPHGPEIRKDSHFANPLNFSINLQALLNSVLIFSLYYFWVSKSRLESETVTVTVNCWWFWVWGWPSLQVLDFTTHKSQKIPSFHSNERNISYLRPAHLWV